MADNRELLEAVLEACRQDGGGKHLDCSQAFLLAAQYGVTPKVIGDICNSHGVKVRSCQLGCF